MEGVERGQGGENGWGGEQEVVLRLGLGLELHELGLGEWK